MGAIIIDMPDLRVRTPKQVVTDFFGQYIPHEVEISLWEAFRGYAVNDEKGLLGITVNEREIADLFDALVELVKAVQVLYVANASGHCPYCLKQNRIEEEK